MSYNTYHYRCRDIFNSIICIDSGKYEAVNEAFEYLLDYSVKNIDDRWIRDLRGNIREISGLKENKVGGESMQQRLESCRRNIAKSFDAWGYLRTYLNRVADNIFSRFSRVPYHPYSEHSRLMHQITLRLSRIISDVRELCATTLVLSSEPFPDDMAPLSQIALKAVTFIEEDTIPKLLAISKDIRTLITKMRGPQRYYSKMHVIKTATSYPKCSKERYDAIKEMVPHIPICERTLYNLIRSHEKGSLVHDEEWRLKPERSTKGEKRSLGWRGSLVLAMIPTEMQEYWKSAPRSWDGRGKGGQWHRRPAFTTDMFAPPKPINLCDFMLDSENRFYFSPTEFPTPTKLEEAGGSTDTSFQRLKKYIEDASNENGSPVVCNGGDSES